MKNIAKDISSKTFKTSYLLFGEEDYLKKSYKNQLIEAIVGENTMNFNRFEGKVDSKEIIELAQTVPFFSDYRLILLEDTGFFKSADEALVNFISQVPASTVILFVESNVDKRSKMYKAVKEHGYPCDMKFQTEEMLAKWAARILAKSNKKITNNTMLLFLSKTGTNMDKISTELEKLISYSLDKEIITDEDVEAVCTSQIATGIFNMIDAISARNQKKTLDYYYDLIYSKEPPMRILFMLERQFNLMLQAKELSDSGMGREQIAREMGVASFVAGKCISQSRNFTLRQLKNALAESVYTEEKIKSGRIEEKMGVEILLVKYSAK
ncbi:MAG: DNA polymerase III subunit delta [Eubacterium sp.]